MKIVYGVCSWGLGHATRSLPIMRRLIKEGEELTVISHGRSLDVLKNELGKGVEYISLADYPMLLSENSRQFLAKSMVYWPVFIRKMQKGLNTLTKMLKKRECDLIISDGRYDIYSKHIPSFFISHQMRIMNPLRLQLFENGSEIFNLFFFKRFCGVLVPDYETDDLSGSLSHNLKHIDETKIHYVGVLSDFQRKKVKKDIDFLVSISGPEPQRTRLEEKIKSQIDQIEGKIFMTMGKAEEKKFSTYDDIETFSFVTKDKREELLNRAKMVISRSGYSTIMDLGVIGTKALLIPTPGQIEQEYLGQYHNEKGTFYSVNQKNLNLVRDIKRAKNTTGIKRQCNVNKTVENILDVFYSSKTSPFK